jgi:hypothetical protein
MRVLGVLRSVGLVGVVGILGLFIALQQLIQSIKAADSQDGAQLTQIALMQAQLTVQHMMLTLEAKPPESNPLATQNALTMEALQKTSAALETKQAEASTLVPVAEAATLTPVLSFTKPLISNFIFCDEKCSSSEARLLTSYQGYTEDLWLRFDFENMERGMNYYREWWSSGKLWIRVHCTWQGGESGSLDVHVYDREGGFLGGNWRVNIVIEDEYEFTSSIFVDDDNKFWDPVGDSYTCPDW